MKETHRHEQFEVDISQANRVLHDWIDVSSHSYLLKTSSGDIPVESLSAISLSFDPSLFPQGLASLQQGVLSGTLTYNDTPIQDVSLSRVQIDDIGLVYEVVGAPIDLDFVEGVVSAEKVLHEQEESLKACQAINEQFKVAVLDVKSWLQSLKVQCEREERAIVMKSPQYQERFRRAFSASVSQHLTKNLPTIHRKLIPFLSGLEPESLSRHTEFFRAHLGEIFHLAPFSHRSFTKPRGYAGDFEMMNQLYRNDFEGESIFAAALHHYFINEPAGQAVRNRREYLKRKIVYSSMKFQKAEGTHIASIACGPAQELVDSMDRLGEIRSNFYFDCIDQDEVSLQGALINLKRKGIPDNVKVSFKNLAIKNIIARGLTEGKYDLVYSAGLFDYFSEPVAKMAAKVLLKSVKPGGQLIIGNFSKSNPTLALMNLAWDWHLIYRSEGELKSLFSDLGAEITIEKEDLGINLFCVLRKIE